MASPRPVKEPEKELRFTRARLALFLGLLAGLCWMGFAISFTLFCELWQSGKSDFPTSHPAWMLVWALPALLLTRATLWTLRHAYLLLTPIGVEMLPIWRPQSRMQAVFWPEITKIKVHQHRLTLHLRPHSQESIHFSLWPLSPSQIRLLTHATEGRMREIQSPSSQS